MVSRSPAPNSYRWLEWGTETLTPRSRVFDSIGNYVFTGSRVRSSAPPERLGVVEELISPSEVVVRWRGGLDVAVSPDVLVVLDAG